MGLADQVVCDLFRQIMVNPYIPEPSRGVQCRSLSTGFQPGDPFEGAGIYPLHSPPVLVLDTMLVPSVHEGKPRQQGCRLGMLRTRRTRREVDEEVEGTDNGEFSVVVLLTTAAGCC